MFKPILKTRMISSKINDCDFGKMEAQIDAISKNV